MLSLMRKGSVMVDVAVDQGGCFETTHATYHDAPTYDVDGIVHYCVANMPGAVPRTSTIALTNATLRYGLLLADNGLKKAIMKDPGLIAGINTCQGKVTYEAVAIALNLEFTPYTELR
jgi:alanine dehydrogenase